ncbi:MAG: 1,4-alpha-glucan branching protein domain-containing protein, partial [Chloroflexota bacterium]
EGVEWLKQVLRRLAASEIVDLTTPSAYIERYPPAERIALPESSWGAGSDARTWMNEETRWMWPIIHDYERQMETLLSGFADGRLEMAKPLKQIARELLLLQSSDWPFLVSTGQAAAYASQRFRGHAARFDRLVEMVEAGEEDRGVVEDIERLDNPFSDIDYHAFAEVPPPAEPMGRRAP